MVKHHTIFHVHMARDDWLAVCEIAVGLVVFTALMVAIFCGAISGGTP